MPAVFLSANFAMQPPATSETWAVLSRKLSTERSAVALLKSLVPMPSGFCAAWPRSVWQMSVVWSLSIIMHQGLTSAKRSRISGRSM